MATLLSALETQARRHLVEATASFWSSAELIDIMNGGIRDLWRPVVDLKQEHFLTVDATNVTLAASTPTLSGIPSDVHKVYLIEARDTSSTSANKNLEFKPLDYNHPIFQAARSQDDVDPSNGVIYYCVTGAGSPTGASSTVIEVAPEINAAMNVRFVYVPTIVAKVAADINPIPAGSDNALVAWTVAFARAKEREDRSPDPNWLAIYATEKQSLLQSLGLRQLQEPTYVDGVFDHLW
mgnify:FL=1